MELIGYGIATLGPALAIGWIFSSLINSVARQPEARNILQPLAILGFAVAEALAILGFVLFFLAR
ncbi:ATP synthase F0 subunit C [Mobilicoccus pelagius]|uniref:ATP synthase subunit c n=1 Tax=Mobilicoccus pelagius NBRC 104925 TaxID=1089455 RepID=H5UMS5_9MICO|nr:ATP synthase F0 subunit C [Mobilicoccus pelagius]GAB47033.1 ATP synthase subunit c [Mobilicoccus pelagius NBRC 104925]